MKSLATALDKLAGAEDAFTLEHRIFNASIFLSGFLVLLTAVYMLIIREWAIAGILVSAAFFYAAVHWVSLVKHELEKAALLFSVMTAFIINVMWVAEGGIRGTTPFFMFLALVMLFFTVEKPMYYAAAMVINVIFLVVAEDTLKAMLGFTLPTNEWLSVASLSVCILYLSGLCYLYKKMMRKQLDETFFTVMNQIQMESDVMGQTADQLAEAGQKLLDSALLQKTAIEQLSATTEELNASAEQNKYLAGSAVDTIQETELHLSTSKASINKLVYKMGEMRQSSEQIHSINSVINDISYQTNILSLNAMIEASRAGEGNGGFKIVALEVKKLAERSANAADNINRLLEENFQSVKSGVNLTESMNERFNDITTRIHPLASQIQNVADSSTEQSASIGQIMEGLIHIDKGTEDNQLLAENFTRTVAELRNNASSLSRVVKTLHEVLTQN